MKLSKLFVLLVVWILLTGTPSFANDAEDRHAYDRAYGEFMTSMSSFSAFRFEDPVTRQESSKFLLVGAEALGIDLSSDQKCDFTDLDDADPSLLPYIYEWCKVGIFKAQRGFQPFSVLTRAQAELTIARILKWYDSVNEYASAKGLGEFEAARAILTDEGVIGRGWSIDPQSPVLRWHLLLMLYRLPEAGVEK